MYFDRNISENKQGKQNENSYLSCVRNGEFYFDTPAGVSRSRGIHLVKVLKPKYFKKQSSSSSFLPTFNKMIQVQNGLESSNQQASFMHLKDLELAC